jgi:hypothetical protein
VQGKEGVLAVLRLMQDYSISREDVDFITGGRLAAGMRG